MRRLVIDASILAKLFLAEEGSSEAAAVVRRSASLAAPDLLWAEVGNVLWKRVRRGELSSDDAERIAVDMLQMPIEIVATSDLLESALRVANETNRSVYDSLYLALAIERNCRVLTADDRFVNALAQTRFAKHLRRI